MALPSCDASRTGRTSSCRAVLDSIYEGNLIALIDEGAVVKLSAALPHDGQTILTVDGGGGEAVHLRARVVRSFVRSFSEAPPEHYVAVEFVEPFAGRVPQKTTEC